MQGAQLPSLWLAAALAICLVWLSASPTAHGEILGREMDELDAQVELLQSEGDDLDTYAAGHELEDEDEDDDDEQDHDSLDEEGDDEDDDLGLRKRQKKVHHSRKQKPPPCVPAPTAPPSPPYIVGSLSDAVDGIFNSTVDEWKIQAEVLKFYYENKFVDPNQATDCAASNSSFDIRTGLLYTVFHSSVKSMIYQVFMPANDDDDNDDNATSNQTAVNVPKLPKLPTKAQTAQYKKAKQTALKMKYKALAALYAEKMATDPKQISQIQQAVQAGNVYDTLSVTDLVDEYTAGLKKGGIMWRSFFVGNATHMSHALQQANSDLATRLAAQLILKLPVEGSSPAVDQQCERDKLAAAAARAAANPPDSQAAKDREAALAAAAAALYNTTKHARPTANSEHTTDNLQVQATSNKTVSHVHSTDPLPESCKIAMQVAEAEDAYAIQKVVDLCSNTWTQFNATTCTLSEFLENPCDYHLLCANNLAQKLARNFFATKTKGLTADFNEAVQEVLTISCAQATLAVYRAYHNDNFFNCNCPDDDTSLSPVTGLQVGRDSASAVAKCSNH